MHGVIAELVDRFERGGLTRRQLIEGLAAIVATAGRDVVSVGTGAGTAGDRINHTSVLVTDLQRSIDFYGRIFGLKSVSEDKANKIVRLGDRRHRCRQHARFITTATAGGNDRPFRDQRAGFQSRQRHPGAETARGDAGGQHRIRLSHQGSRRRGCADRVARGEATMPSHFIWYELLTPDADASQRFYSDVVGWTIQAGHDAGHGLSPPDGAGRRRRRRHAAVDAADAGRRRPAGVARLRRRGGRRRRGERHRSAGWQDADAGDHHRQGWTDGDGRGPAGSAVLRHDAHAAAGPARTRRARRSRGQRSDTARGTNWRRRSEEGLRVLHRQFGWTDGGSMPMGESGTTSSSTTRAG